MYQTSFNSCELPNCYPVSYDLNLEVVENFSLPPLNIPPPVSNNGCNPGDNLRGALCMSSCPNGWIDMGTNCMNISSMPPQTTLKNIYLPAKTPSLAPSTIIPPPASNNGCKPGDNLNAGLCYPPQCPNGWIDVGVFCKNPSPPNESISKNFSPLGYIPGNPPPSAPPSAPVSTPAPASTSASAPVSTPAPASTPASAPASTPASTPAPAPASTPAPAPASTPAPPPLGGDRDSYGCIMSAGYQWCETLNKCVRSWETPCIPTTAPPPPSYDPPDVKPQVQSEWIEGINNSHIIIGGVGLLLIIMLVFTFSPRERRYRY